MSKSPSSEFQTSAGGVMIRVPAGYFTMGSPESEDGHRVWERRREVNFVNDFYLGKSPVTQDQYEATRSESGSVRMARFHPRTWTSGSSRATPRLHWRLPCVANRCRDRSIAREHPPATVRQAEKAGRWSGEASGETLSSPKSRPMSGENSRVSQRRGQERSPERWARRCLRFPLSSAFRSNIRLRNLQPLPPPPRPRNEHQS
jgi:formylglycine-generating enzyme required for sulfatase activity